MPANALDPRPRDAQREGDENRIQEYLARFGAASPSPAPQPQIDQHDTDGVWSRIKFDLKPDDLVAYLDQYIVRQEEAKAVLATKICTHFNRAKYLSRLQNDDPSDGVGMIKNNILLIGPTGVGKTYMIKLIADKLGVPFVKADATKFSETGYVGGDVEDLIRDLVREAEDDIELAQFGIVYLDEVDKIAGTKGLLGPDVSRSGVQRALLKPMEETEVDLKVAHDPISQIQAIEQYRKTGRAERRLVNTRHILFIMSGAFGELAEVIRRRRNKAQLGFSSQMRAQLDDQAILHEVTGADLVEFGFETEFVGRLPVTVVLDKLEADDLHQILRNPNNPVIISKKRDFAAYGIELRFEDEALRKLAEEAAALGTGARALVSVCERVCLPFERHLPSSDVRRLVITPECVDNPGQELQIVLGAPHEQEPRFEAAGQFERAQLMHMIDRRQAMYAQRLQSPLTPARMALIADEFHRVGLSMERAFRNVLDRLDQVRDFALGFSQKYGITISFSEDARVAILAGAAAEGVAVDEYLKRLSTILEPGLKLARDRTGVDAYELPRQAIFDTDAYLRQVFEEHFSQTLGAKN